MKPSLDVGLAPMEGVTDFATRLWFSLTSAPAFMSTPFLRITEHFPFRKVDPLYAPELLSLAGWSRYQLTPQLMTGNPDDFTRIAEQLLRYTDYVDLNCGCPAPTVVGNGAGSAILRETEKFHAYVEKLCASLGAGRLSVKMRLGFTDENEFAALLAGITDLPLAQLQIHGRTRTDRYTGKARWEPIARAAAATSYPVVGSGDINTAADFRLLQQRYPGIRKVLIGRGALRQPWIFSAIRQPTPDETWIDAATVLTALEAFCLLQNLQLSKPRQLLHVAEIFHDLPVCDTDLDRWLYILAYLIKAHDAGDTKDVTFHPHTLGRTKMLWNYWRSSMPTAAFAPQVFRTKNLPDFLAAIASVCGSTCGQERFALNYHPEWDWLYAGEKRGSQHPWPQTI